MSEDKKEDRDMETPVVAQPRSFLEVLGVDDRRDTHEYRLTWVSKKGAHHVMSTCRLENISDKIVKLYKQRIEATAFNSVTGEKVGAIWHDDDRWNYFYKTDDDPVCIRCDVVLDTAEGFQTGICANCWKPETDGEC